MANRDLDREAVSLPRGYWAPDRVRAILDKTLTYRVQPDLSTLTPAERQAVAEILAVGEIMQDLHEDQAHRQALRARRTLQQLHEQFGRPARTEDLLDLYDLSQGPIATTLDNELLPFLPVAGRTMGKNVYPWGIGRDELEKFFEEHPEQRGGTLHPRSVLRRTTPASLRKDGAQLRRNPAISRLHPGLDAELRKLSEKPASRPFYAVPYSLAWPDKIAAAFAHLSAAATAIQADDADLGDFLRQRARDLLTDDYEAGDAAWIRGRFGRLDAVIGAYESYDDELYGAKTFFSLSLLRLDEARTRGLQEAMRHLQEIEDALPIGRHKDVDRDVPIAAYEVIAASGIGRNTAAEILPNDVRLMRKYGRKILMRAEEVQYPELFARVQARWRAGLAPAHHDDLTPEGDFQHIVWHEVGHYLGPDTDASGRSLNLALEDAADLIEELKAELASQFAMVWLAGAGAFDDRQRRANMAAGILSGLRPVKPQRSQPYPTLWLMELNFFLEHGFLVYEDGGIGIRYERHAAVIEAMLREVLSIQDGGSRAAAAAFIDRYVTWDERHETLARALRAAERYRFLHARYAVLEGPW